jgi:predicted dehydrogenase
VTRPGRAELRGLDLPLAGPGELTVEMLVSAVSVGTERAQWLRLPNSRPDLPFAPGYSGAGRVLAVGRHVDGFEPGTLVAVPRARHASVVTVPADWVSVIPDGVRVEEAALVYLAIIAGYGLRRAAGVTGDPVCILGTGPIGALAHRLLMLRDPGPVTVVAAGRRGETAALRAGAARFVAVDEGTRGIEAAVVIDATGDPTALPAAVAAARAGATIVLLGSPRGVTPDAALDEIRRRELRVVGAHVSALAAEARRDSIDPFGELSRTFLEALGAGRLDVADIVGEAIDPREIGLLYRRLARRELRSAHLDWAAIPRANRVVRRRIASLPQLQRVPVAPRGLAERNVQVSGAPLRFAIVGCGDIGYQNAKAVAQATNAELALVHDRDVSLAAAAAAAFGGEVAGSLEAALDPARVDAVFLSVPHDLHATLVLAAAEAGLHVVVEKPLSVDLSTADTAVAAAAEAGVALSVCFPLRYDPAAQAARSLVQSGALGPLRGATVLFHADKPPSYWTSGFSGRSYSPWRLSRSRAGGGVLIMNLTHYIDLLRYVAGAEIESVAGSSRSDVGMDVEDSVALSVVFNDGAIGSISGSASTRGAPPNRFEVWGETGTLRLEPDAAVYTERAVDGVLPGRWTPLPTATVDETRRVFVERFATAILEGRPVDVAPRDGLAVQAFVDAAYRAIETGESVRVAARPVVAP